MPARPERAPTSSSRPSALSSASNAPVTVPDDQHRQPRHRGRADRPAAKPIPSAMMPAPTNPPVNPASTFLNVLAGIGDLPVDQDRGVHRTDEGDHGDHGGDQRRPPRIGGSRRTRTNTSTANGHRDQRDPEISGQAAELVDEGHQQRRQDARQHAAGRDLQAGRCGRCRWRAIAWVNVHLPVARIGLERAKRTGDETALPMISDSYRSRHGFWMERASGRCSKSDIEI